MANVTISGQPYPFSLPAASALTGAEYLPVNQTGGGGVITSSTQVNSLFNRATGSTSVSSNLAPTWSGQHTWTPGSGVVPLNITPAANTSAMNISLATATAFDMMTFSNLNGSGDLDFTAVGNMELGTVSATALNLFTNNSTRLSIDGFGSVSIAAPTSTNYPCLTVNGAAVAQGLLVVNDITTYRSGATTSGFLYFGSGSNPSYLCQTGSLFQLVQTGGTVAAALELFGGASPTIGGSVHTYGSASISASANGYAGIQFTSAFGAQGRTLMVATASAIQGFYDTNASAWDWYVQPGTQISVPSGLAASSGTSLIITAAGSIEKLSSSRRYKLNIKNLDHSVADNALKLRPISYTANPATTHDIDPTTVHIGLIAEEVAEVIPNLVNYEYTERPHHDAAGNLGTHRADGVPYDLTLRPESVQYDRLAVLLLDIVKRQDARIRALEEQQ